MLNKALVELVDASTMRLFVKLSRKFHPDFSTRFYFVLHSASRYCLVHIIFSSIHHQIIVSRRQIEKFHRIVDKKFIYTYIHLCKFKKIYTSFALAWLFTKIVWVVLNANIINNENELIFRWLKYLFDVEEKNLRAGQCSLWHRIFTYVLYMRATVAPLRLAYTYFLHCSSRNIIDKIMLIMSAG